MEGRAQTVFISSLNSALYFKGDQRPIDMILQRGTYREEDGREESVGPQEAGGGRCTPWKVPTECASEVEKGS